jgi:hypothetical protein
MAYQKFVYFNPVCHGDWFPDGGLYKRAFRLNKTVRFKSFPAGDIPKGNFPRRQFVQFLGVLFPEGVRFPFVVLPIDRRVKVKAPPVILNGGNFAGFPAVFNKYQYLEFRTYEDRPFTV